MRYFYLVCNKLSVSLIVLSCTDSAALRMLLVVTPLKAVALVAALLVECTLNIVYYGVNASPG